MNIQFDEALQGQIYSSNDATVFYPDTDGLFHTEYYLNQAMDCTLTGYWVQTMGGNIYYLTTQGWWILKQDEDWAALNKKRIISTWTAGDANKLLKTICDNNMHILANNLLCARYASKLNAQQRKTLFELQTRLQARNAALANDGFIQEASIQTGYPKGYAEWGDNLESFMQSYGSGVTTSGVGVTISTTAIIIISCVVIGSLATAAYYAYKAYAEESRQDIKYSDELTAVLASKLTEDEYQQLMNETQSIVTKAKIKASLSSGTSVIGIALIGLGILTVMNLWRGGTLRR